MSLTLASSPMIGENVINITSNTTASALGYTVINVFAPRQFVISNGVTFTIDVPFYAGEFQVFDGAGSVSFTNPPSPVEVAWFGDLTGDFGAIMSKAINSVRLGHSSPNYTPAKIRIPNGRFTATTPINATGLSGNYISIVADSNRNMNFGTIIGSHNGVVLDCTASPGLQLININIQGGDDLTTPTPGSIPTVGILFARKDPGNTNDAGYHYLNNVALDGHFSKVAICNYAAEVDTYENCIVTNRNASADGIGFVSTNFYNVSSTFQTIATGAQSCTVLNIKNTQMWTLGGGTSSCFFCKNAFNVRISDCFVYNPASTHGTFAIEDGGDIKIEGIREETDSNGALYSCTAHGTIVGLTLRHFWSSSKETTGYFLYGVDASDIYDLHLDTIHHAYVNNYTSVYDLHYPYTNYSAALTVRNSQTRGVLKGNPTSVASNTEGIVIDISKGSIQTDCTWQKGQLILGTYYFWVSATAPNAGKLMIKNGAPANDNDGTVVGSQ